jgi:hypothetical protein
MIKLLSKSDFNKGQVTPFLVSKEFKKNPEGNFGIYFFNKVIIDKDEQLGHYVKKYRYIQLRYEQEPALFLKRKDAISAARYRLGLDPEPIN